MKIKKSITVGIFTICVVSLIYMEIKETHELFGGNWSIEREEYRQQMIQDGLNKEEIKQNLREKRYKKEDYVRG